VTSSGLIITLTRAPAARPFGLANTPISVITPSAVTRPGRKSAAPTNSATKGVAGLR